MYTVYRAYNIITGKSYIGVDSNWPHRKAAHKHAVKRGSNLVFHNAIRSYGWDNFEWTIVEQSDNHDEIFNLKEEYYIRLFNTYYLDGNGYNMTYGGEATLGWVPSEETRQKISEANKGRSTWNKGKPSPWTSERNRRNKGVKKPQLEKIYILTDPEGNEYTVKGLSKFCELHNLSRSNLCSVASGKIKSYKGWKCRKLEPETQLLVAYNK